MSASILKVADKVIGGMTAPVTGSGSWPEWTALVLKPSDDGNVIIQRKEERDRNMEIQDTLNMFCGTQFCVTFESSQHCVSFY